MLSASLNKTLPSFLPLSKWARYFTCSSQKVKLSFSETFAFNIFVYVFQTGASKGYAFIEFRSEDVAKIVAETMNNYLMFEKLLKCKKVHIFCTISVL